MDNPVGNQGNKPATGGKDNVNIGGSDAPKQDGGCCK